MSICEALRMEHNVMHAGEVLRSWFEGEEEVVNFFFSFSFRLYKMCLFYFEIMYLASLQQLAAKTPKAPYKALSIKPCSHVHGKELLAPFYRTRSWRPGGAVDAQTHRQFPLVAERAPSPSANPSKTTRTKGVGFDLHLLPSISACWRSRTCTDPPRSCPWG